MAKESDSRKHRRRWWTAPAMQVKVIRVPRTSEKGPKGFTIPFNEIETLPSGAILRVTPYWVKCACPKGKRCVMEFTKVKLRNGNTLDQVKCSCK